MDDNWGIGQLNTDQLIEKYSLNCVPETLRQAMKREGINYFWAAEKSFLTNKNQTIRREVYKI